MLSCAGGGCCGETINLRRGRLVSVSELFSDEEMKSSAVYNELTARTDTRDSLDVRLDGPAGSRIVWAFADPVDDEGWSSARVERIGRLLPHVRQFVRVRRALAGARALGASMAALLGHGGAGVIQLDRRGRIAAANDCARALMRAGRGLTDRGGELGAARPGEHIALQGLLARALPSSGGGARRGPDGERGRARDRAEREYRALASPAHLHQARPLPAGRGGAGGDGACRRRGAAAVSG